MRNLTVRLLEARARTTTARLLRLHATRVRDEQGSVVRQQKILNLLLGSFVDILLVVRDEALGHRLSHGIHLGHVSTTLHANADVHVRESLLAEQENGFNRLESESVRLDEVDRDTIEANQALTALRVRHGDGGFLSRKGKETNPGQYFASRTRQIVIARRSR